MSNKSKTTNRNANGYDWKISTSKDSRGNLSSSATGGKMSKDGFMWEWRMFQDPTVKLLSEPCSRLTDKVLENTHGRAIMEFDLLIKAGKLPERKEQGVLIEG